MKAKKVITCDVNRIIKFKLTYFCKLFKVRLHYVSPKSVMYQCCINACISNKAPFNTPRDLLKTGCKLKLIRNLGLDMKLTLTPSVNGSSEDSLCSQWRIQDFPEEGAPTPRGCQHTILPNFPKNCMKLKEFGPPGRGARPSPPLDPPLVVNIKIRHPDVLTHFSATSTNRLNYFIHF